MDRAPLKKLIPRTSYCRSCNYPRGPLYGFWPVCPVCKSFWNRAPIPYNPWEELRMNYYATFPKVGPFRGCYCRVPQVPDSPPMTWYSARDLMFNMYGAQWDSLYTEAEKPEAIDRLNLREIVFGTVVMELS